MIILAIATSSKKGLFGLDEKSTKKTLQEQGLFLPKDRGGAERRLYLLIYYTGCFKFSSPLVIVIDSMRSPT